MRENKQSVKLIFILNKVDVKGIVDDFNQAFGNVIQI